MNIEVDEKHDAVEGMSTPKKLKAIDGRHEKPNDAFLQGVMRVADEASEVRGSRTGHFILLGPSQAGNIYMNGRLVERWSSKIQSPSSSIHPSIFGYDLISQQVTGVDSLKGEISQLIFEVLIDANQAHKDVAGMLLSRLIYGCGNGDDAVQPCLESEAMGDPRCDPVGISAKALATKFSHMYGKESYPCITSDIPYVIERIGSQRGRDLVPVPQRTMAVLRRGGYLDLKRTDASLWFNNMSCYKTLAGADAMSEVDSLSSLCESGRCDIQQRFLELKRGNSVPKPGGMTLYVKAGPDGESVGDCPFAHFVRIILEEKGTLYNKPKWLIDHHDGSMPALRHRETDLAESEVIAKYLDYFFAHSPLSHTHEMMAKAKDVINGLFPAVARYLTHTPDGDKEDTKLKIDLENSLQKLENYLHECSKESGKSGPYMTGEMFTLVDSSLAPKLYHMQTGLEAFKAKAVDVEGKFPEVKKYMDHVFARPSFAKTVYPKETVVWGWNTARSN